MPRNITRDRVFHGRVPGRRQLHSADLPAERRQVLRRRVGSDHQPYGVLAPSVLYSRRGRSLLRVRLIKKKVFQASGETKKRRSQLKRFVVACRRQL